LCQLNQVDKFTAIAVGVIASGTARQSERFVVTPVAGKFTALQYLPKTGDTGGKSQIGTTAGQRVEYAVTDDDFTYLDATAAGHIDAERSYRGRVWLGVMRTSDFEVSTCCGLPWSAQAITRPASTRALRGMYVFIVLLMWV
jgi:hypothetical protein